MTLTRLYLIRHGQSYGNAEEIMVGMATDRGLTALGREQAARLRDRLAATGEIAAGVLIASSLPRARETAEIIAPALGLDVILDDDVHELRCGEGEGLSFAEFDTRYGEYIGRSATEPADPGGECWSDFRTRVSGAITRIAAEHTGQNIVLVCHGGVIEAWLVEMFGTSRSELPAARMHTNNTSITAWERDETRSPLTWRLHGYNDDVHLRDLGSEQRFDWSRPQSRVSAAAP
ncbi:MAG: histidine phosphatase family protein [Mycobacteriales bacterium]